VFIKLHITEHTGRGVPRITEAYGKDVIRLNENSIVVAIPFERLGQEVYEGGWVNPPVEASTEKQILNFCMTPKNILEIAEHLGYKDKKTVRKYLNPLIAQGRISRTIQDKPNSRLQKYVTIRI
jgi:predicted HTH transcriptional regulator